MAEITDTVKQLGERVEYFPTYTMTTASFIGPLSAVTEMAKDNRKGNQYNSIPNTVVQSSVTEKMEADRLRWNVSYKTWISGGGGGGGGDDKYISQTWGMNMTQYEFPLDRYLDPENAEKYNNWKNLDLKQRKQWKYLLSTDEKGEPVYSDLSGMALSCAQKYFAGIESVMKFYPQVTRNTVYEDKKDAPTSALRMLNQTDSTPETMFKLSASWLKSGYDWQQNNDDTWTLNESWIGVPSYNPWDKNLYTNPNKWMFYVPNP